MNLYHIQDPDRPMHVLGRNWIDALNKWKQKIAEENDCAPGDVEEPDGIALVCEEGNLLI